ncbi:hypothetical protein FVEG_15992 [Fusarium verticillioides 7600]|uniref:Uncharacterized protein n=1 Tax=Gibberella moniliformis (strain M3125 / FGSC 7600) TaxID=334819 RepID=W7M4R3_GIBM7|nr:hypothetical protein FVEG_15992 [Fusarium verticillioides 7600]EWG46568.1 hypothetical protein FVEG_15992 [Fusarium verticillioides 7600]
MPPNRRLCAPVYFGPETIRDSALKWLKALQNIKSSQQWVDDSTIFLNEDGSFSHKVIKEGSFKVHAQKVSLFLTNLFSPSKASKEEQRLQNARRRLLVSLLAHAWLWGRPRVLDDRGNPVAFKEREVLAPEDILDFLGKARARKASYTHKDIHDFLSHIKVVALHEDMSKWNITGVIACLRWDQSHNLHNGGPWCSCRLEKKGRPPPYDEVCPHIQEGESARNEKIKHLQ